MSGLRWSEEKLQRHREKVSKARAGTRKEKGSAPLEPPPPPPARSVKGEAPKPKTLRSGKYNAKKVTIDCIKFDSKKEGKYYEELKLRRVAGEVSYFLMQVPFHLPGGVIYKVDFQEFLADGTVRYVDTKGFETAEFKLKKKQVEALYPVIIEVV